jgi:hypothetical protein
MPRGGEPKPAATPVWLFASLRRLLVQRFLSSEIFVEETVILASTAERIRIEYFGGQDILFSHTRLELENQIATMTKACARFDWVAFNLLRAPGLDLRQIRIDLGQAIQEEVPARSRYAQLVSISSFGDEASIQAALVQFMRDYPLRKDDDPSPDEPNVGAETKRKARLRAAIVPLAQKARTELQLDVS